jgi:hypothetical protein
LVDYDPALIVPNILGVHVVHVVHVVLLPQLLYENDSVVMHLIITILSLSLSYRSTSRCRR